MTTRKQANTEAVHQAARLNRISMRLQRAKPVDIHRLLHEADDALNRYKLAKNMEADAPNPDIEDTVEVDLREQLQALGGEIHKMVTPMAYALFVFNPETKIFNFISNANRDDIAEILKEFQTAHERDKGRPDG